MLFCCTFSLSAEDKKEFLKEIDKSFDLNKDGRVELSNQYGQINVTSWEKEEVKINVRIVIQAIDQATADKVFERVRIDLSKTSNTVSATTQIGSGGRSWWERMTGYNSSCSSDNFKIIYNVTVPNQAFLKTNGMHCNVSCGDHLGEVDIYTKHGNVDLGEIGDYCRVETAYGNASIDVLNAPALLKVSYGNLDVEEAASELDVNVRYGKFNVDVAQELVLDSRYTDTRVGKVARFRFNGSYGDIEIGEVDQLRSSTTYLDYEIRKIHELMDITTAYGDVNAYWLSAGFIEARFKGSYADIDIRIDPEAGYEVNARANYADVDLPSSVDLSRKETKSSSEMRRGKKSGRGSGYLDISSAYGDVSIRE